jgi:hypothetical protein
MSILSRIFSINLFFSACSLVLPLYIDLESSELVLSPDAFTADPIIPFPVFILYFSFSYFIYALLSFNKGVLFLRTQKAVVLILLLFFLLLYIIFFTGSTPVRALQIAFLIFPLLFLIRIKSNAMGNVLLYFLIFLTLFFVTHLASIIYEANGLMITKYDFAAYWGYDFYSALVSYPGTTSLYACFGLSLTLFSSLALKVRLASLLLHIVAVTILFLAARKISIIELSFIYLSVFIFSFSHYFYIDKFKSSLSVKKKGLLVLVSVSVLFSMTINYFFESPLFSRFMYSVESDTVDGDRLSKIIYFHEWISTDMARLFFGVGGGRAPGMHNYFLDTISRVGLFGIIIVFSVFLLAIKYIKWYFKYKQKNSYVKFIFFQIIVLVFLQSSVNSPLTQPYYAINLMLITVFLLNMPPTHMPYSHSGKNIAR